MEIWKSALSFSDHCKKEVTPQGLLKMKLFQIVVQIY
jgi:hypothetical protein